MAIRLRLDKEQIDSIGRVLALDSVKLSAIRDHWGNLDAPPLRPSDLIEETQQCLDPATGEKLTPGLCEDLVGQLLSLYTILRRSDSTLDEIRLAIGRSFQVSLNEEQFEKWHAIEDAFFELMSTKVVRLAAMALELSYDYANLLRRTNIIADIRPLFDENAGEIEAAVVSYTLRLEYSTSSGGQDVSIALDQEDLLRLREQCDRALCKAATIELKMEEGLKAPTTIPGKESKK
ncbi:hypothetical protein SH528x_002169 [Novipirellula sp. SH528]|uniref:hypothetical protein n=1 Tax=Novipirellula sp. SH528 TaxID=3454466 RepID=UPI003F9EFDD8